MLIYKFKGVGAPSSDKLLNSDFFGLAPAEQFSCGFLGITFAPYVVQWRHAYQWVEQVELYFLKTMVYRDRMHPARANSQTPNPKNIKT